MKKNIIGVAVVIGVAAIIIAVRWSAPGKNLYGQPNTSETPAEARLNPDGSYTQKGKTYYAVKSADPTGDTGDKACAKVNKKCVGYTDLTVNTCLAFHPSALTVQDMDGARPGFYCNGPPQGGVCGREMSTCHICPECNLNMNCSSVIGDLYNETFVECK